MKYLGIILLITALSLFTWAVVTQRFELRKRAEGSNQVGQKTVKVLVIEFNAILASKGGVRLSTYEYWNEPTVLESDYIQTLKNLSSNYANYQITQRIVANSFPKKNDGFAYTENSYLNCLSNYTNCHNPDMVDYLKILNDYQVCEKRNSGEIDELWLWGGPYFGYWEAVMAGPDAFNTNATPLSGTSCAKNLHIMGFNYERGLSEMLEDFGHRTEGTMTHVFTQRGINFWENYTKNQLTSPGNASCGSVHVPPNGTIDYDWTNTSKVASSCEDWLNYPALTGAKETFGCEMWGCTGLGWKEYWLKHFPKAGSYTNNTWDNWWKYVIDYENAIENTPTPAPIKGDINGDSLVNTTDLSMLLSKWGNNNCGVDADLNNDCKTNATDLSILLSNWKSI